jgi:membrane protein YdbS with pleckstrin-like domain
MLAPREPDEYLLDTERRVIRIRRHWAFLAWDSFEACALIIVCVLVSFVLPPNMWVLQNVLWYVAFAVILRFVYKIIEWWVERLVVTDKRFVMTTGVLTTKVLMMPISKVTDLTYQRSWMGRMLGYGTMVVESAGQIQALNKIEYLPQPEEFYDVISELVFGDKQRQAERFSTIKAQRAARGEKLLG